VTPFELDEGEAAPRTWWPLSNNQTPLRANERTYNLRSCKSGIPF
jgi:hypothetical protein